MIYDNEKAKVVTEMLWFEQEHSKVTSWDRQVRTHTQTNPIIEAELSSQHSWFSEVSQELAGFVCPTALFAF